MCKKILYSQKRFFTKLKKKILKKKVLNGILAYFNPGEMIAIIGPSCLMLNFKNLIPNPPYMYREWKNSIT